jgi:sugar diacid utilization regulator
MLTATQATNAANGLNGERCGPTVIRRSPVWPAAGEEGEEGEAGPPAAADQDAVRLIVGRFSRQLEPTAKLMVSRYCHAIADYRLADGDFLDRDVYLVSLDALRVTIGDLEHGRQGVADEFSGVRAGAARRVHQDVALESFLHAVRLWGKVLWESVLSSTRDDVAAERGAALAIAGRILEHIDLVSVAAAQGYLDELQSVWSDREVIRRDLLDALISGDGDSEQVRRLARSLRLRLGQDYIVVVVRTAERRPEEIQHSLAEQSGLRRIVEAVRAQLLPVAGSLLMGVRHGEVIALYPFEHSAELGTVRRLCAALAGTLESADARIGISSCHLGLPGLATSYAEAREAAEIAADTGTHGRVVAFEDVLIDSIVRASGHADRILEGTITPLLAYDAEHKAELVATLRAYIEAGFNLTRCAESRSVHPNTIVYRLRRVKELTGRDPHVPDDLLLLQLGLKLTGLSSPR